MQLTKTLLAGAAVLALMAAPAVAQPAPGQPPGGQGPGYHQDHYDHGPQGSPQWGPQGGRHWRQGDHFSGNRMVIRDRDYGRYHLRRPPPGYQWVNSNGQFLLIAITSGIIASVIAGSAY